MVKVANGASIATCESFKACFEKANETFDEPFLILKMSQTMLSLPFSENNDIVIHPRTRTLKHLFHTMFYFL